MHFSRFFRTILAALCCGWSIGAAATNYYISPLGSDANTGSSASTAWQSIAKINAVDLEPGDTVFFERAGIYPGSLQLDGSDHGTVDQPLVITAYGTGNAPLLSSGTENGLVIYNADGILVNGITLQGSGVASNAGYGISLYMDTTVNLSNITLKNCDVSGFSQDGILIYSYSLANGYRDILLDSCRSHDNGISGIGCYGSNSIRSHANIRVRQCKVYGNTGLSSKTTEPSGSGIVLSSVDGALIEYCEAYDNGINNSNPTSGPIGIWFYQVSSGIIQHCESHHNKAGLNHDGGGFDIDGGSQDCVIQYCYSHDNEGAGFLLAEYGAPGSYVNNTVRFNISQNDGRKNGYGAISVWGSTPATPVTYSYVYSNTIYLDDNNLTNGTAAGIYLIGSNFTGVKVFNNIIFGQGNVEFVHADAAPDSTELHLLANLYYSTSANFYWNGSSYASLPAWKTAASTQEKRGTADYAYTFNPLLSSPGSGGTVGDPTQLGAQLMGYAAQSGSNICGAGISPAAAYGQNPGPIDFFGNSLPLTTALGAGVAACNIVTPIQLLSFSARESEQQVLLNWETQPDSDAGTISLERSADGMQFIEIQSFQAATGRKQYSYTDNPPTFSKQWYYRLKLKDPDGGYSFSKTLPVTISNARSNSAYLAPLANPARGEIRLVARKASQEPLQVFVFNSQGQRLQAIQLGQLAMGQQIRINGSKDWAPGLYFIRIVPAGSTEAQSFPVLKQ